jgi:hypothetical protein
VEQTGLDLSEVREIWERFQRRHKSTSWSRIWALVVLINWCRQHDVVADTR